MCHQEWKLRKTAKINSPHPIQFSQKVSNHWSQRQLIRLNKLLSVDSNTDDDRIRMERLEDSVFEHGKAFETITNFYSEDDKGL